MRLTTCLGVYLTLCIFALCACDLGTEPVLDPRLATGEATVDVAVIPADEIVEDAGIGAPVIAVRIRDVPSIIVEEDFLVDGAGMSLYLFTADEPDKSNCGDDCIHNWPPLGGNEEVIVGEGVNAELLGAIERTDGMRQVTYNGWPLYYFFLDKGPGHVKGHNVQTYGGGWYLVTPDGLPVEVVTGED